MYFGCEIFQYKIIIDIKGKQKLLHSPHPTQESLHHSWGHCSSEFAISFQAPFHSVTHR